MAETIITVKGGDWFGCFFLFCFFKEENGDWGNAETKDLFC